MPGGSHTTVPSAGGRIVVARLLGSNSVLGACGAFAHNVRRCGARLLGRKAILVAASHLVLLVPGGRAALQSAFSLPRRTLRPIMKARARRATEHACTPKEGAQNSSTRWRKQIIENPARTARARIHCGGPPPIDLNTPHRGL